MPANERVRVIIPTSINLLTALNDVFLTLHRAGEPLEVGLPSLRRRALLVVNEIGTLPIQAVSVTQ